MAAARMRSQLGRAIGLGSSKEGVEHWWRQRTTAALLVPLTLWFVAMAVSLAGADRQALVAWMHNPMAAVLMVLLIVATFYHTALGLQVVIEDYVHGEALKLASLVAMRLLCILFVLRGVLAVLKLAFAA
ncbi:MAG: succinate dehydrogenase, hydrophobic membrane anchor protein [Alphaproteobacteria bacterium]|nr:succinate dehydrogenase, hydrophobic membrane anchor protein [Alphaproteobacteria bacterium]